MTRIVSVIMVLIASVIPLSALAQVGDMKSPSDVPRNGLEMAQVVAKYGEPGAKSTPVGKPPITRWAYDGYTVYFEHQKVLHSVVHVR